MDTELPPGSNVISINKNKKVDHLSKSMLTKKICEVIEGTGMLIFPEFDHKFCLVKINKHLKLARIEKHNKITLSSIFELKREIGLYGAKHYSKHLLEQLIELTADTYADSIAKSFVNLCSIVINDVKVIKFKDSKEYAYNVLPFDLKYVTTLDNAPTWNKIIKDMYNGGAFCTWLGALLLDSSNNKQAVFLSGETNAGKSTIVSIIYELLSDAMVYINNDDIKNGFFSSKIHAKKLVVFPEAKNSTLSSQMFKLITGEDTLLVTHKYENSFTAKNTSFVLLVSNETPSLSNHDASLYSRVIDCRINKIEQVSNFRDVLKTELEDFICYCACKYLEHVDSEEYQYNKFIKSDFTLFTKATEGKIEEVTSFESDFFDAYFAFDENAYTQRQHVWDLLDSKRVPHHIKVGFRKFLLEQKKVVEKSKRIQGNPNPVKVYLGIKII